MAENFHAIAESLSLTRSDARKRIWGLHPILRGAGFLNRQPARQDAHEKGDDGEKKGKVNETAQSVGSGQPKPPEDKKRCRDGQEHERN